MGRLRLRSTAVGDALLIHARGLFDDRAAAFAAGIAEDPHHTVVVVDLPADALVEEWTSVARILSPSRYGSPRLVFGRGTGAEIRAAGCLIADRIGREVLAPDGDVVPTLTGGLFVPGDDGAAWLRFRPGRDPEPAAQRFPKPHWEFAAPARTARAGARAVAQPVAAGVWLRHTDPDPLAGHHRRAVETLPTDLNLFLIILGSPGTPPLSLDDVVRFWDTVPPRGRSAVRFMSYGALDVPDGRAPGQTLADALGHQVVLYPCPFADGPGPGDTSPEVYLPAGDRTTGPTPSLPARVVEPVEPLPASYPGPGPTGTDTRAVPGSVLVPALVPAPMSAGVVLGVSIAEPFLPRIRTESMGTAPALPAGADASPVVVPEPGTPDVVTPVVTMPAVPVIAPPPVHDPALGEGEAGAVDLSEAPTVRNDDGATDLSEAPTVRNDDGTGEPDTELGPAPDDGAADLGDMPTVLSRPRVVQNTDAGQDPEPAPETGRDTPAPETESVIERSPGAVPTTVPASAAISDAELASASPSLAEAPAVPASSPAPTSESEPAAASGPAPQSVRPAAPRFRLESAAPEPGIDEIRAPAPTTGPAPEAGVVPSAVAPVTPDRAAVASSPSASADTAQDVRVQPVPRTAACALPPERGIAQERDWVRRTFSEQYHAVAGSVSRVMSESPGLRGRSRTEAADALAELVAVRLYLSGDSRRADAAVREAKAGPHVPLARCVTAGLRRLPSYRGPALLRTRLGEAERAWYREGRVITEWAFCHARTSLHPGPRGGGATGVLIWSMTARRTSSLDPAVPDRVLFLPGTAFKVLRNEDSVVLMRELSPSEIAEDGRVDVQRVKLDEIALKGLEKILDALEKAGTDAGAESADPPGLIVHRRAVPTEGAKP